MQDARELPEFTMEEVRKHASVETGVWVVMDGLVYDVSRFDKHPGQFDILLVNAGRDATKEFNATHSEKARKMRAKFVIGRVKKQELLDPDFEAKNVVPLSDVPRYYYLLPLFIFALFVYFTAKNNNLI